MSKANERLEKMKQQREQLNARIQKMEAAQKSKEKKKDTRRKILIGAYTLDQARKDGSEKQLYEKVKQYLTRETDKQLFEAEHDYGQSEQ